MAIIDLFKSYNIGDLEKHHQSQNALLSNEILRSRVCICVIDDEMFFHLETLRNHGFDIVQIGNISNLGNVEKYDIVACDLRGVGGKFNEKLQGASIIQEIKRSMPEKFIIAYSGSFDRSNMSRIATDIADRKIVKSADIDKWISVLDDAIATTTNPIERWRRMKISLVEKGIKTDLIYKLEKSYCKSVIKNNRQIFIRSTSSLNLTEEIKPIIQGIVASALWAGVTS
jgi:DNA-binding NarL/FixJ family response regulator